MDSEGARAAAVFSAGAGRAAAMPRLVELDGRVELTSAHVRLVAVALGKSERTVWRWLAAAREDGRSARREASRFTVTSEIRQLLAFWGGNASRVHAELAERARKDPDALAPPSLSTLHRAIRRDLSRGERAGLKSGERARRAHDVFGRRPPTHRNAVWEGDHKHLRVEADVEGELATPWVTWFIDCASRVIVGAAVTAHAPSRDAVLAALRIAFTRTGRFGPAGGLPSCVRVDCGKEFLCGTVTLALGAFAVPVHDLPAYTPHLKGTVEALNDAVEEMFLAGLPRYTRRQRLAGGRVADPEAPPLTFEAFVGLLLDWITWWNTGHRPAGLGGLTSLQVWQQDPTPLTDIPAKDLASFTLEDNGRTYTITTGGVQWKRRHYLADWMVGHTGTKVVVRHLPHHNDTIEIFDAASGRQLGSAFWAEAATFEQIRGVRAQRDRQARRLKADLGAAEKLRRKRFEAVTGPAPPRRLGSLTAAEARAETGRAFAEDLHALARPDYVPHGRIPDGWVRPIQPPTAGPGPDPALGGEGDMCEPDR